MSRRRNMTPLTVAVKDDRLTITIGVGCLTYAAQRRFDEKAFDESGGEESEAEFRIVDANEFAKDVRRALEKEQEDGTTPVHLMLDAAFDYALDYGTISIMDRSELTKEGPTK